MTQKIVAAAGFLMGVAIGVLMVALGLGLMGSPWEFHFTADVAAVVAVMIAGVTVVAVGAIVIVDLVEGESGRRHRPRGG